MVIIHDNFSTLILEYNVIQIWNFWKKVSKGVGPEWGPYPDAYLLESQCDSQEGCNPSYLPTPAMQSVKRAA